MSKLNHFLMTSAFAAIIPISGLHASTISFGTITGAPGNDSRSWNATVSGSFTDYALFTTTKTAAFATSVTNSYATSDLFISGLTLSLYSGAVVGSGTLIDSVLASNTGPAPGNESADLTALAQKAGDYYLEISGSTTDSPSYAGSLSISLSTVPLPASAPMFGAALMALGGVGYGLKRKKAAAAA